VIGETYRLEEKLGEGGLGPLYRAVDVRSDTQVALRALSAEVARPEVVEAIGQQVEIATELDHKNIVKTFGMATEGALHFVVTEYLVGQSLREIIEKKRRSNKPFTLKGAYNIVAHLCNACGYAHETTFHGALHPGNVLVTRAGRVKVSELGFARALSGLGNFETLLGGNGYLYLAPEMSQSPATADARADIYAIGVLLNELLTGRSPADSFETPSSVRPGLPVEVDQVIGRCMRPVPDERFDTIQELKLGLMGALEGADDAPAPAPAPAMDGPAAGAAAADDFDVDVDVDVDLGGEDAPAAASTAAGASAAAPAAATPAPAAGAQGKGGAAGLPADLPPPPAEDDDPFGAGLSGSGAGAGPVSGGGDAFDLDGLISQSSGEDEEKYLISKKGLDFGPFSLMEVKRQIAAGDIRPQDTVVEQDTGKRSKVKSHPLLKDFTKEVVRRKEAQRRAEAEVSTEAVERRKKRVLVLGVVAAVGVIAVAVGSILIYQGIARKKSGPTERGGDELSYQGSDEDPSGMRKKGRRGRRWRGRRGRRGSVGLNRKVAASESFDFGGGSMGGRERLSAGVIKSVIDKRRNRVGNCMVKVGAKRISVFVQVKGSGKLAYVSAKPKSATRCVRRALAGLRFPKFNGKLTQGNYSLSM